MYIFEYIFPAALSSLLVLYFLFRGRFFWILCAFFSVMQVLIFSFRPEDYNSDTFNYSKYLTYISDADGLNILTVSKFEPLHLVLALFANDFKIWLILEAVMCSYFLIEILRRLKSVESIAVVLGSAVPLFSSSMRFSVGLLAVAYGMLIFNRVRFRWIIVSMIGLMTHISLAAYAFIQRGKIWPILILMAALQLYAGSDISFIERAGGGGDNSAGGSGLRAFSALLIFLVFSYIRSVDYKLLAFLRDALVALILLFSTNFIYPVFNRFIVLFLIMKAIQYDSLRSEWSIRNSVSRGWVAFAIYLFLVIPHIISIDSKISAGDW